MSDGIRLLIFIVIVFFIQLIMFSDIFSEKLISLINGFSSTSNDDKSLNFIGSLALTGTATLLIVVAYVLIINL